MTKLRFALATLSAPVLAAAFGGIAAAATVHPASVDRTSCSSSTVQITTNNGEYVDCFGSGAGSLALYGVTQIYVPSGWCYSDTENGNSYPQVDGPQTIVTNSVTVTYIDVVGPDCLNV